MTTNKPMTLDERAKYLILKILFPDVGERIFANEARHWILDALQEAYDQGFAEARERAASVPGEVWINGASKTAEGFCDSVVEGIRALTPSEGGR